MDKLWLKDCVQNAPKSGPFRCELCLGAQYLEHLVVTCHLWLIEFHGKAHFLIHVWAACIVLTFTTQLQAVHGQRWPHWQPWAWALLMLLQSHLFQTFTIHNPLHRRGQYCQLSITHNYFICNEVDLLDLLRYLWHNLQQAFPFSPACLGIRLPGLIPWILLTAPNIASWGITPVVSSLK